MPDESGFFLGGGGGGVIYLINQSFLVLAPPPPPQGLDSRLVRAGMSRADEMLVPGVEDC